MRTHLLHAFVTIAIASAAACACASSRADENTGRGNDAGIVTVSAPQPVSAARTSVTLWDEIAAPTAPPLPVPPSGEIRHAMQRSAETGARR
jgi:hypothetical protein